MGKQLHTVAHQKKTLLAALRANMGIVKTACEKAGVPRRNHYLWLEKDAKYAAEVADIDEEAIDFAENQLKKLMSGYKLNDSKVFLVDHVQNVGGNLVTTKKPLVVPLVKEFGPDATSVIFFLKTRGKKRGYLEKTQVETETKVQAFTATVQLVPAVGGVPIATSEKEVDDV
jgi:hypothetical protein